MSTPIPTPTQRPRIIVDPNEQEAEDAFQLMMQHFGSMTREERVHFGVERGVLNPDGTPKPIEGEMPYSVPMELSSSRIIVDPAEQEAEDAFQRMMQLFGNMTREERVRFGVERGVLNPDGTPRPIEGDPCVTQ